jgi:cytochrome b6-f complex iron-sulfur subunit
MMRPTVHLARREFVAACAWAVASAALSGCASMVTRRVPLRGGRVHLALDEYPELTRPGGAVKILPEGMRDPLYVLALESDGYAVLSPICTHRGCTVDVQGARLVCPCHGSTYDRRGNVLRGPAERPLARLSAVLAERVLEIDLGGPS